MGKFITILFIGTVAVFTFLYQQITATRFSYQVAQLQRRQTVLNNENDLMRFRINSMLALERLDRTAREQGLRRPAETSIVFLD